MGGGGRVVSKINEEKVQGVEMFEKSLHVYQNHQLMQVVLERRTACRKNIFKTQRGNDIRIRK